MEKTKMDYLINIDFDFLIKFMFRSKLYRNYRKYTTKRDFVFALSRLLTISECKNFYLEYKNGISPDKLAEGYLNKNPTMDIIRDALVGEICSNRKDEVVIFEFPVLDSRTDVLHLNGYSINYEIKTERDKLDRLLYQLPTFSYVFEKNYVVCNNNSYDNVLIHISENIGVIVYALIENKLHFKIKIPARKSKTLNPNLQLSSMPLIQLKQILEKDGYYTLNNLSRIDAIKKIESRYTDKEINKQFKTYLKEQYLR